MPRASSRSWLASITSPAKSSPSIRAWIGGRKGEVSHGGLQRTEEDEGYRKGGLFVPSEFRDVGEMVEISAFLLPLQFSAVLRAKPQFPAKCSGRMTPRSVVLRKPTRYLTWMFGASSEASIFSTAWEKLSVLSA